MATENRNILSGYLPYQINSNFGTHAERMEEGKNPKTNNTPETVLVNVPKSLCELQIYLVLNMTVLNKAGCLDPYFVLTDKSY